MQMGYWQVRATASACMVASYVAIVILTASGCSPTSDRSVRGRLSSTQAPDRPVVAFEPAPLDLDRSSSQRSTQSRDRGTDRATLEAIRRASLWLAAFPEVDLRFDNAVGLYHVRRMVDSAALREAGYKAKSAADRDDDHPMHRFWDRAFVTSKKHVHEWQPPIPGEPRANVNRVVIEALYCHVHGLRDETLDYLSGPMRDGGGYHTTHALWALVIASERGCVEEEVYLRSVRTLQQELLDAQPRRLVPKQTLDIDLYAERSLMLALSGYSGERADSFVRQLIQWQSADGGWGVTTDGQPPYYRYHATMTSLWALTANLRGEREAPTGSQIPRQDP